MKRDYKRDNDLVEESAAKIFSDKRFGRGNYSILTPGQDESVDVLIEPHKVQIQVVRAGSDADYRRRKDNGAAPITGGTGAATPTFQVCEAIRKKIEMDYHDVNSLVLVIYCEMSSAAFDSVRQMAWKISKCITDVYPAAKIFKEIWCVCPVAGKEDAVCLYKKR